MRLYKFNYSTVPVLVRPYEYEYLYILYNAYLLVALTQVWVEHLRVLKIIVVLEWILYEYSIQTIRIYEV